MLAAGSRDDVLEFLRTENLTSKKKNFSFRNLLYLLEDKDFFTKTIQTLRDRGIFSTEVWQYAFFHKDDDALMSECIKLNYSSHQFNVLGTHFTSGLVTINELNAEKGFLKLLEYHPMVNTRAHNVGKEGTNTILNRTFNETYNTFLSSLAQKKSHETLEDRMIFVYYLQLQDRIEEAITLFKSIEPPAADSALKVQHDYLTAYFDFFNREDTQYLNA